VQQPDNRCRPIEYHLARSTSLRLFQSARLNSHLFFNLLLSTAREWWLAAALVGSVGCFFFGGGRMHEAFLLMG
ncbi:MAG: hypothetical protein KH142_09855, partial [Slackia piriformis]|nr:hypothetical protein [Slackia piriformis]